MPTISVRKIVDIPMADIKLPTRFVSFCGVDKEHFAVLIGDYKKSPVLTRVHSECITGDVFGSTRCDCGPQLREALGTMTADGGGVVIYMRHEGRGIGLYSKFDAYGLQSTGIDTFTANEMLGYPDDSREFESAAAMLLALGVGRIKLMTNNPEKSRALKAGGVNVDEVVPSTVFLTAQNGQYLRSKKEKKQHTIEL